MRVLWFSGNPSLYDSKRKNFDGGWVSSLEEIISQEADIELGITFVHSDNIFKTEQNNVVYYPLPLYNTLKKRVKRNLFYKQYDKVEVAHYLKVIEDFKPDVIHVFGTETSLGLICKYTTVPVVIHIQGLLAPYLNAYFIPNTSKCDFIVQNIFSFKNIYKELSLLRKWRHNTSREIDIIKNCHFFMGRTSWDKSISRLMVPGSDYFYCSELLRNSFYTAAKWKLTRNKKLKIISTISSPVYKGYDVILKTAEILKNYSTADFEWNVYGISASPFIEKKFKLKHGDVGVNLKGVANADVLISEMHASDIYIHLSYIENSPNSICEAQLIGIPVICTHVGGVASLVQDYYSGILVPANDPYMTACKILELFNDSALSLKLSAQAVEVAEKRHSKNSIKESVLSSYKNILTPKAVQ